MIIFICANGMVAWNFNSVIGLRRQAVCLNDGFTVDIPIRMAKNPRAILIGMRDHSEGLAGQTRSISEIRSLT